MGGRRFMVGVWIDCGRVRWSVDAARHWHERLGVTPHAVLTDVETLHLLAGRNPQADGLLDDPEQSVAEDEDGDERSADGDRLRSQLVKAARVKQAPLTDAVE